MRLDENEWVQVRAHAGYSGPGAAPYLLGAGLGRRSASRAADGKDYSCGLAAGRIPIETRINTVADIFDANTAERPCTQPDPMADAIAMMGKGQRGN